LTFNSNSNMKLIANPKNDLLYNNNSELEKVLTLNTVNIILINSEIIFSYNFFIISSLYTIT